MGPMRIRQEPGLGTPAYLGDPVCVLIMPYLGALKGWLYKAVLAVAPASAASVRIPVLLLGAVTLWLTFCFCPPRVRLADRSGGNMARRE